MRLIDADNLLELIKEQAIALSINIIKRGGIDGN